ncbi:MAG TPA: diguanylate cyclase [Azospira sp.]|nr:diguanylate cyclase [Azospira sp.]
MPIELHGGTLTLGVLLIAPLLAVGNLVVWWQTRERAMVWWAAGSLAAATAAPQFQPATVDIGYVSVALALCFYWEGIRSFQRRPMDCFPISLTRPSPLLILALILLGAASAYREPVLAAVIGGISAICAYELIAGRGRPARESSNFVGGLFALHAAFFFLLDYLVVRADAAGGVSMEAIHLAVYAELLVLLIGWNVGFVMLAMQRYLELATDLATHDELTGILNRRALGDKVRYHMKLAERGAAPFSVLAMDLDHFKQINDSYGHHAGDSVLRAFVHTAQSCLRTADLLGRVGGEEFVALLPATSGAGARVLAERLRQTLAESAVRYRDASLKITVSIGVAEFDRRSHDFESLLEVADKALYEAKHRGRNRVELAPCPAGAPFVQLVWDSSYSSGNLLIDAEHERLFEMVNRLVRKAQEHSDVRALQQELDAMLYWLSEHFRHEEAIFVPSGWAGAAQHIVQHQLLEARGRELLAGIADGRHAYGELLDFLILEVIGSHLAKEDATYFRAIVGDHGQ